MKKISAILRKYFMLAVLTMVLTVSFTSCECDDWHPVPPGGFPSDFWDSRLSGYWQLVQINGYAVSGMDVNYMFFNGSGRGVYYYFLNDRRYCETIAYWCQDAVDGYSDYQVNVQYSDGGSPTTRNDWFGDGGRVLYFQWVNHSGLQTYAYTRYPSAPW